MLIYWLLFLSFGFLALVIKQREPLSNVNSNSAFNIENLEWGIIRNILFVVIAIFIGFRMDVGGDFGQYRYIYSEFLDEGFIRSVLPRLDSTLDPGFGLINWIVHQFDADDGIYWNYFIRKGGFIYVNFIGALIFSYFFIKFIFSLERPFLALSISFPYLILVVAMGYVRQGIALGIISYALIVLGRKQFIFFTTLIIFAATIHKSAVLFLPILFFTLSVNRFFLFIGVVTLGSLLYLVLIATHVESLVSNYVEYEFSSAGAIVRLGMMLPPAFIFLKYKAFFSFNLIQEKIWMYCAAVSIVLFFLAITIASNNTTALDRIGLYFLLMQVVIFSKLPDLFPLKERPYIILLILIYYFLILFTWLFFADNSHAWLPYKNILFMDHSAINYLIKNPTLL